MREVPRPAVSVSQTLADKIVEYFDPIRARERLKARAMMAVAGQWIGGRTDRRQTKNWKTVSGSADNDLLFDLPTMRDRSRDLMRNNPLALGAVNTVVSSTIGTGLSLMPTPDAEALGMTDEQGATWGALVVREFNAWANNPSACDAARRLDFYQLQELAFRSALEAGDCFALLPMIATAASPYQTKVQLIEADRVTNKDRAKDSDTLAGGVQSGPNGEPVAYHILKTHPGGFAGQRDQQWDIVPAFGEASGRRNVLHIMDQRRVGQTRGYPFLAPVIEPLRQLQQYTEAEIMAAVVSGMFTVFVQTETGQGLDLDGQGGTPTATQKSGDEVKLGYAAIVDLAQNESVQFANPNRPNQAFDPFVQAILRQVGVALELPFEVLIKHFTASYSAARAALLEAWKFFKGRRALIAKTFCQPIFEAWLEESVAMGRIPAPGFFDDPVIRAAYCNMEWIGDSPGQLDPLKEIQAARERIAATLSNHEIEAMAIHGLQWRTMHKALAKEIKLRQQMGTLVDLALATPAATPSAPQDNGGGPGNANPDNPGGNDTEEG